MTVIDARRRNASIMRGLQYFEAVARNKSVRAAAEELGVSQSAVSHQLRELTKVLGEQLLVRSGRGVAVTPVGQQLAERLFSTFASLQTSLEDIVGGGRQLLRLAVCSSFGPSWLVPRLGNFLAANPGIDLQLHLYAQDPHLSQQVADAIISALPLAPGYSAIPILDEMLVAVHAPGGGKGRQRLITTDIDLRVLGKDWLDFFAHTGMRREDVQEGQWLQCTHYLLALEMARAGLGIALVPDFLAERDIQERSLAFFESTRVPSRRAYQLCFKHSRRHEAGIKALASWVKVELLLGSTLETTEG
jgi:LysR family transcriptional regulator, glycine cleavage system transcriptional activator